MKPKLEPDEVSRNVEKIVTTPEKREKILNEFKKVLYEYEHHKKPKLLNVSTVSELLAKKRMKVNDLLGSQYSAKKNIRFKKLMC